MTARLAPVAALLGIPLDMVDEAEAQSLLEAAIAERRPLFLSTPNLNFLIGCQSDEAFRDSVLASELSVADGMPLIWMARWLGVPLPERVAGSSLFHRLSQAKAAPPIRVCFFGGPPGVAQIASDQLNANGGRMIGCGAVDPGFGSVESMGRESLLQQIRDARPDFLVVALGAVKGQAWILRHRATLGVPVISHLGAVVNFVAGNVRRAPRLLQRLGLEWLWRIREEPSLWRRYWNDGRRGAALVLGNVLPHGGLLFWYRRMTRCVPATWQASDEPNGLRIALSGDLAHPIPPDLLTLLESARRHAGIIALDLSAVRYLDPVFAGLLLRLEGGVGRDRLQLHGARPGLQRLLRWNGVRGSGAA